MKERERCREKKLKRVRLFISLGPRPRFCCTLVPDGASDVVQVNVGEKQKTFEEEEHLSSGANVSALRIEDALVLLDRNACWPNDVLT